jgi:effector-binding domain-containing protein
MLDSPQIKQTAEQQAAVIRLTIPRAEIGNMMGPGFHELMGTIAAQGIAPAGAFFSHHLRVDPDVFDFEIGVPVSSPVSPTGRVTQGVLPGTTVIRTTYRGGYEGLGEAWGEFEAWIQAEGLQTTCSCWESYLAGPESNPNPATWRTELNRPLATPAP